MIRITKMKKKMFVCFCNKCMKYLLLKDVCIGKYDVAMHIFMISSSFVR